MYVRSNATSLQFTINSATGFVNPVFLTVPLALDILSSMEYIAIAVIVLVLVLVTTFLYYRMFAAPKQKKEKRTVLKSRDQILKEANKRLAVNPKDKQALAMLADLYFSENDFEKAAKTYRMLLSLAAGSSEIDEYTVTLRHGLSCAKIGAYDEAMKSLLFVKALKDESVEANFYLGLIEFEKRSYEKAIGFFKAALKLNPDHTLSLKYLGLSLKRMGQIKEALRHLKVAMDRDPSQKDILFELGECYDSVGHIENAVKIFSHLRPDPKIGPKAALNAAVIHLRTNNLEEALMDLNIGLKHPEIPHDIQLELLYQRAHTFTQMQNLDAAIKDLKTIRKMDANYKDVNELIQRLAEFSSNRHLQTYIVAPTSEFLTLCKSLTLRFFNDSTVKIQDVSVHKNEYADLLTEVNTAKWMDTCLFRFIRSTNQVGDTLVREMATQIKELKAGRGVCVCAGEFTIGARQFVEARQIDLVDKSQLLKWLAKL